MQYTNNTQIESSGGRTAVALASLLRSDIRQGTHRAGQFMPPVRELARIHGAATVTVHRALKMLAHDGLVLSQPRHGYRVRPGAADPDRGLPVAYVHSAQHIVGQGRDTFYQTLLLEFQRVAGRRGWSVLTLDADLLSPGEIAGQIAASNACGAIVNSTHPGLWKELERAGVPVVLVDAWSEHSEADCVLQDGFMGGLQAAGYLAKRAHQRVAWFGPGPRDQNPQILERYSGAAAGLARIGGRFACEVHAPLGDPKTALQLAKALLKRRNRPTAVLALWQNMAEAIARAAAELNLVVGRDFEMVGWCTEEEYEGGYRSCFPKSSIPPAIVWSIARLADAAVARLKQRRAEPNLAPAMIRIPTRLRIGGAA